MLFECVQKFQWKCDCSPSQIKSPQMLIGARSTSRRSRFQPPDSPNKRQVSLREMLMFSYKSGRGRTVREIAQLSGRSPTTVGKYVKLAKTTTETTQQPDVKAMIEQVIRHFVLYALLRNPTHTLCLPTLRATRSATAAQLAGGVQHWVCGKIIN